MMGPRARLTELNLDDLQRHNPLTLIRGLTPEGLLGFGNLYCYLDPRPGDIPPVPLEGWDCWVYLLGATVEGRAIVRARVDRDGDLTANLTGGQGKSHWGYRLTPRPIQIVEGLFAEHRDDLRLGKAGTPAELAQPLAVISIFKTGRQYTVSAVHAEDGYALTVHRGTAGPVLLRREPVETFKARWDGLREELLGLAIELSLEEEEDGGAAPPT